MRQPATTGRRKRGTPKRKTKRQSPATGPSYSAFPRSQRFQDAEEADLGDHF